MLNFSWSLMANIFLLSWHWCLIYLDLELKGCEGSSWKRPRSSKKTAARVITKTTYIYCNYWDCCSSRISFFPEKNRRQSSALAAEKIHICLCIFSFGASIYLYPKSFQVYLWNFAKQLLRLWVVTYQIDLFRVDYTSTFLLFCSINSLICLNVELQDVFAAVDFRVVNTPLYL